MREGQRELKKLFKGMFVVADVPVAVNGIVDTEDVEAVSSPKTKIESWEATKEIEAEEGF